jgi:hypothetical protein
MSTYSAGYVDAISTSGWSPAAIPDPNPSGLCGCGCGGETRVEKNGRLSGHHSRFIFGHHSRPFVPQEVGADEARELEEESRVCREIYLRVVGRRLYDRRRFYRARTDAWDRDSGTCACGEPGVEVHHIQPLHLGGDNDLTNLITLCWSCHRAAHAHIRQAVS